MLDYNDFKNCEIDSHNPSLKHILETVNPVNLAGFDTWNFSESKEGTQLAKMFMHHLTHTFEGIDQIHWIRVGKRISIKVFPSQQKKGRQRVTGVKI